MVPYKKNITNHKTDITTTGLHDHGNRRHTAKSHAKGGWLLVLANAKNYMGYSTPCIVYFVEASATLTGPRSSKKLTIYS